MREIKVTKQRQEWMSENGFNPDEVTTWRLMWQRLKYHASTRNLECTLSFEDYLTLAKNACLYNPELIGRNKVIINSADMVIKETTLLTTVGLFLKRLIEKK